MAYSNKFAHERPNNTKWITVLNELGIKYSVAGENVAYNSKSQASYVANQWKNSENHYNNMINKDFTKIGIGMYKLLGENRYYWVQLFS